MIWIVIVDLFAAVVSEQPVPIDCASGTPCAILADAFFDNILPDSDCKDLSNFACGRFLSMRTGETLPQRLIKQNLDDIYASEKNWPALMTENHLVRDLILERDNCMLSAAGVNATRYCFDLTNKRYPLLVSKLFLRTYYDMSDGRVLQGAHELCYYIYDRFKIKLLPKLIEDLRAEKYQFLEKIRIRVGYPEILDDWSSVNAVYTRGEVKTLSEKAKESPPGPGWYVPSQPFPIVSNQVYFVKEQNTICE